MYVCWQNLFKSSLVLSKIIFDFCAYSHRPLLDNVDIYTSTLILCNSLNYNMIDTKLGTMFIYSSSVILLSYMAKTLVSVLHSIVLIVDM